MEQEFLGFEKFLLFKTQNIGVQGPLFKSQPYPGVDNVGQSYRTRLVSMRMRVQSPTPLSGFKIRHCCELHCRPKTWLESGIALAVAYAGSCSSNLTPSLGNSICCRGSPKKKKKKSQPCSTSFQMLEMISKRNVVDIQKPTKQKRKIKQQQ